MNKEWETNFTNKFIIKNRRSRILYELSNEKKRKDGIWRFCHGASRYIINSKIIYEGNSISNEEINVLIKKYTNEKQCYIISGYEDIDGVFMNTEKAIETIIGRGMASILVFSNLAVIETEQEIGRADKYVLYSE